MSIYGKLRRRKKKLTRMHYEKGKKQKLFSLQNAALFFSTAKKETTK